MDRLIDLEGLAPAPWPRGQGAATAGVVKKLASGAAGTRRLLARYGDALVCVRYRQDATSNRRYTTVELVVDERPGKPATALVRIGYQETALRQRIMAAGGSWDARQKLWSLPKIAIRRLGLQDRVVPENGQIRQSRNA